MKVEQGKIRFRPVIITLDTQTEVNALWHRLNTSYGSTFDDYLQDYLHEYPEIQCARGDLEDVDYELFSQLDAIVRGK